ncbi:MAG: integrin [Kofleriaceae bacterium]
MTERLQRVLSESGMRTLLLVSFLVACNLDSRLPAVSDAPPGDVPDADAPLVFELGQEAYLKPSNTEALDNFGISIALSADGSTLAVGSFSEDSAATGINNDPLDNSAMDAGAVYVFTRSGATWTQQAYIKASNTNAGDKFGSRVALSADGSTLAVGAFQEDSAAVNINGNQTDNSAMDAGAVYVFARAGATWAQQSYIKASNAGAGDIFGARLGLSADGNTLAVGSLFEDSAAPGVDGDEADNSKVSAGAAYVFTRIGATWTQDAYIKASNPDVRDFFGNVALSADGMTLAVGAQGEDSAAVGVDGNQADASALNSGALYVFERIGGVWTQQTYIKASNTDAEDGFGFNVAVSADGLTVAVTASDEDSTATGIDGDQADNSAPDSGAVYVFTRANATWTQQAYVKASNTESDDSFGISLSLSGNGSTLVVSAHFEDSAVLGINGDGADNSAAFAGAAYVFLRSNVTWMQEAYVKASNTGGSDRFGGSISLSADGSTLAIGADGEASVAIGVDGNQSDNTAPASGAAYLYRTNLSLATQ